MTRAAEQFRVADVTAWGFAALGIWVVAILAGNVSALLPPGLYATLHASRLDGGTVNQLRSQVAALEAESARLRNDTLQLTQRFGVGEDASRTLTRRVAAVEVSLPRIAEAQARAAAVLPAGIDSTETGGIGCSDMTTFEAEGGSVSVQQVPLVPLARVPALPPRPLSDLTPIGVTANGSGQGIALGPPLAATEAAATWQGYLAAAGTMLMGLSPALGETETDGRRQLIAGPVLDRTSALDLCARLDGAGIPCDLVAFAGTPLPGGDAAAK